MRCKIHPDVEPIALCKECDSPMCKTCVAFGEFSGLCPYCYLDSLKDKARNYKIGKIILGIFAALFLAADLIFALMGGVLYGIHHDPAMLTFFSYVGVFSIAFIILCVFAAILGKIEKKVRIQLAEKKKQATTIL